VDERPLHHRILAGLALVALIAAGLHCSWVVYTDQADFSRAGAAREEAPAPPPP
jgi:hypothetical protein